MSGTQLAWFKSSHSGSEGDSCIEVAFAWHTSSHSGSEDGHRLQVAVSPDAIHLRDSKIERGPEITFGPAVWSTFLVGASHAPPT
jgi:hypothetical protein